MEAQHTNHLSRPPSPSQGHQQPPSKDAPGHHGEAASSLQHQPHQHRHHHHHNHSHHAPGHHHHTHAHHQPSGSASSHNAAVAAAAQPLPPSTSLPLRTNNSTPVSSHGLFSPSISRPGTVPPASGSNSPAPDSIAPYLHPLQEYKVRETNKALIESDNITGRKLINNYEVIEEIGRGMHGKVKLARNVETGAHVAIKIIPRFSKKRRLGKVMALSPQDKTKKEIAILKKIRHPNVVALLEVIDDPELKKIYMVLEHAELGEVVWRKKGLPHICQYERRRVEREIRGEVRSADEDRYERMLENRQALKEWKRARMAQNFGPTDYWSVEHGAADEPAGNGLQSRIASREDFAVSDGPPSYPGSRHVSRGPSRTQSAVSMSDAIPSDLDEEEYEWQDDLETPGPLTSNPNSSTALDGTMYGAYFDEGSGSGHGQGSSGHGSSGENGFRGRSTSMADSVISHMSSIDYFPQTHDAFADDYSYVPCFTLDQARSTFRDTVLGLEYLHYQGVVHRDIKPANLLWSRDHRVKISDFGVSYFGRPIRDGELDDPVSESEARDFDNDVELSKTVGTPAFFAPELCYTDIGKEQPKVSEQIDVWSLGVTLYCLIYARIPFLAEDEFQMFRKIATEEVHIPRRRLMPVDPSTSPVTTSLYKRHNLHPYRNDNDLAYEDVDPLLCDLLHQMLTKNPEQRIKLRGIKRHPWVVQGISNPIGWLDDTDPARPSLGRKIEVDDRDVSDAVVPLTFLERARSAMRKAVGKVMHPLVDRTEPWSGSSRRRATSSVASSAGDSMVNGPATTYTTHTRSDRRRSLMPDDIFANLARDRAAAQAAQAAANPGQPGEAIYDPLATVLPPPPEVAREILAASAGDSPLMISPQGSLRNTLRHARSMSKTSEHMMKRRSRNFAEAQTTPATPVKEEPDETASRLGYLDEMRKARDAISDQQEGSRSRSVDGSLFTSSDKRASPRVGISQAMAPGDVHAPAIPTQSPQQPVTPAGMHSMSRPMRSRTSMASPLSLSTPREESPELERATLDWEKQSTSAPASASQADHQEAAAAMQLRIQQQQDEMLQQSTGTVRHVDTAPPSVPASPSPDGRHSRGRDSGALTTGPSSSTDSVDQMGTPLTSPSEAGSSPATGNGCRDRTSTSSSSQRPLDFRSDPSLPALLSGASSVSADMDKEAELLSRPGVYRQHSLLETTDSLTPPAYMKEPTAGFPLEEAMSMYDPVSLQHLDPGSAATATGRTSTETSRADNDDNDGAAGSDGSDDGILLMAKSKRKSGMPVTGRKGPFEARRRDTGMSNASTETAKPQHLADEQPWYG